MLWNTTPFELTDVRKDAQGNSVHLLLLTSDERMCTCLRMAEYRAARWHKRYEQACWNCHLKEYREANWKGVADYLWTFHVWNEAVKHVSEYWYDPTRA